MLTYVEDNKWQAWRPDRYFYTIQIIHECTLKYRLYVMYIKIYSVLVINISD